MLYGVLGVWEKAWEDPGPWDGSVAAHGVGRIRPARLEAVPFRECMFCSRSGHATELAKGAFWAASEYIDLAVYSVTSHYTRQTII